MTDEIRIHLPHAQVEEICRRHRVARLEAFGSVLRDDFGSDSDVDLLVEFEHEAQVGLLALSRLQRELSVLLGRNVDLVPRAGLKASLRDGVLGAARVIYEG
jgi:hypothetical protein